MLSLPASIAFASEPCPNEQLRSESNVNPTTGQPYSTELPECRAYELVTPVEKDGLSMGGDPGYLDPPPSLTPTELVGASANGLGALFATKFPIADSPTGNADVQLATRTSEGWASVSLAPSPSLFTTPDSAPGVQFLAASEEEDLSEVLFATTASLDPTDAHSSGVALYLRRADGSFEWISQGEIGQAEPGPTAARLSDSRVTGYKTGGQTEVSVGASSDLSHVAFSWPTALLPEADAIQPGFSGLYERSEGQTRLVDVNSDGSLIGTCGASLGSTGNGGAGYLNDVSRDGSRVFFETSQYPAESCVEGGHAVVPQLYVREDGESTVELSAPEVGSPEYGLPDYQLHEANFRGATPDGSTVFFDSAGLLVSGTNTGGLYEYDLSTRKLTEIAGGPESKLIGFSESGELVYFLSPTEIGGDGTTGKANLYLDDDGAISYIASIAESVEEARTDTKDEQGEGGSDLDPDGLYLLFQAATSLTSYDAVGHSEVYEYDEPTGRIVCISCNPTGAPPTGSASLLYDATPAEGSFKYNNLSEDGAYAFFDSTEALVPRATNGIVDVYEYHEGQISLISTGTDRYASLFAGATPSGSDVYFVTNESLVAHDTDNGQSDIYDARIDGGFAAPPAAPRECQGETCQGSLSAPVLLPQPGGSATTLGGGNLTSPAASIALTATKKQTKRPTRAHKLSKALKRCRAKPKRRKRASCEARARKKYGAAPKTKKTNRRAR